MSRDPLAAAPRRGRAPRRLGPGLLILTFGALVSWEGQARRDDQAPAPPEADAPGGGDGPTPGAPEVWVTGFMDSSLVPASHDLFGLFNDAKVSAPSIGRCDPIESQRGRCVEFVRFLPPGADLTSGENQERAASLTLALRDNLSSLFLGLWDGVVARWSREGEPLGAAFAEQQINQLPGSDPLWGRSTVLNNRVTALPDPERWLLEDQWVQPLGQRGAGGAPFRHLRYKPTLDAEPDESPPPPGLVLMRGRFAANIVFQQRPFDTDLISLADDGGQVFLRQIHPHALDDLGARFIEPLGCERSSEPLACFRGPPPTSRSPLVLSEGALTAQGAEALAHEQFVSFTDLLGMRLLQYGRHEYDISLVRVLGAMVAMASPPKMTSQEGPDVGVVNVSIPGGTDEQGAVRPPPPMSPGEARATSIQYDAMPKELIAELIIELGLDGNQRCLTSNKRGATGDPTQPQEPLVYNTLDLVEPMLLKESPLNGGQMFTDAEQAAWRALADEWTQRSDAELRDELLNGGHLRVHRESALTETLDRLVVQRRLEGQCEELVDATTSDVTTTDATTSGPTTSGPTTSGADDAAEQEQLRGRALLAHVRSLLVTRFPASADAPATPKDIQDAANETWTDVMSLHGSTPALAPQRGTDNVSPVAVCTTTSPEVAQDEPVFKKVSLELLFVASANTSPDEALWEARGESPFLWIDDPERSRARVERLVALADGLAIYRARWELWSGWHLLWGVQPLTTVQSAGYPSAALTTRAAAICEDMVLAPPALVATLVRAGMLDAPLRGTTPVSRANARAQALGQPKRPAQSNDERAERAAAVAGEASATANEAALTKIQLEGSPEGALGVADAKLKGREGAEPGDTRSNRPTIGANDPSEYLRKLIQEPLLRRAGGRPAVILVVDSTVVKGRSNARQPLPSTPYQHRRSHLTRRVWLHSAAWALFLPALPPELLTPNVSMLPARLPNASVKSATARPGFTYDPVTEMTLVADVGMFPWRSVTRACNLDNLTVGHPGTPECPNPALSGGTIETVYDPDTGHILTPPLRSYGLTLSFASLGTTWLGHDPRIALEYGAEAQLDVMLPALSEGFDTTQTFSWEDAFAPRAGLLVGVRFAPDPLWTTRYVRDQRLSKKKSLPRLWGAEGDDGRSQLTRAQLGLRGGVSYEPLTDGGAPIVISAEGWMGWSQWRRHSLWAPYTPYQPNALLGPYLRYQYSFPLDDSTADLFEYLDHRHQIMFGLRVQPRFDAARFQTPEVE